MPCSVVQNVGRKFDRKSVVGGSARGARGTRLFPLPGEIPKLTIPAVVDTSIGRHVFGLLARHYAMGASGDLQLNR
jgi:hypothetical protein